MSFTGFLEVGIGFLVEPEASISERSVQDTVMRAVSQCGEGFISNLVYALLGVSAMSRVNMRSFRIMIFSNLHISSFRFPHVKVLY